MRPGDARGGVTEALLAAREAVPTTATFGNNPAGDILEGRGYQDTSCLCLPPSEDDLR